MSGALCFLDDDIAVYQVGFFQGAFNGHLEKVKRMVEEGYDCSEVLVQLAAVRSALDNTGKVILKDHMRHCMVDAVAAGDQEAIEDLIQAIDKLVI